MQFEIERTNNFRFQYNKLTLRMKRFIDEAVEVIKESPTAFQGKITALAKKKEGRLYRYRVPGAHILYVVNDENPIVTLTNVKTLY